MKTKEEREALITQIKALGIPSSWVDPPLTRLAWSLGVNIKPPIYASSTSVGLIQGVFFGIFWSLAMYLILWGPQNYSLIAILTGALFAGVLFGAAMGYLHHRARKKILATGIELPEW